MTEEALDTAWDRIDCRLVILDWPADPPDDLVKAVIDLVTFEVANPEPANLPVSGGGSVLTWRGHLTGGLVTLAEWLMPVVDEHGLSALLSDSRLEVLISGGTESVFVSGALRQPVQITREDWRSKLAAASTPEDLMRALLQDAFRKHSLTGDAEDIIERARERNAERGQHLGGPPPERIEQTPPGHVDFDLLEEAETRLIADYDPDDELVDAVVMRDAPRWRTDLYPPGFGHLPGEQFEESFSWRVAQWRDETPPDPDDEVDGDEPDGERDWHLRAKSRIDLVRVLGYLPLDLHTWAQAITHEAIERLGQLSEELDEPWVHDSRAALAGQLEAVDASAGEVG